jgi:hypothetical protein
MDGGGARAEREIAVLDHVTRASKMNLSSRISVLKNGIPGRYSMWRITSNSESRPSTRRNQG